MQNSRYATDFNNFVNLCRERNLAIQTIKSIVRRPWSTRPRTHNTYFYEPLEDQFAIDAMVHWSMSLKDSFLITAGDMKVLPKILDAAARFEKCPSDEKMNSIVDEFNMRVIRASMSDLK
jgi:hypothetical protein